jgi:putative nucleotidyltransferase with HDIG domain
MCAQPRISSDKLMEFVSRGINLPPLSALAAQLVSAAAQPQSAIVVGRLAELIESDPVLTAKILRLANSPYFGVRRGVTSVRHAIALMGLGETLSFLAFAVVKSRVAESAQTTRFRMEDFWTHSWACATTARMLGTPQYLVRTLPGELYLAGLLHDIGKVALALHAPDDFDACLEVAQERGIPLFEAEREVLDFDHATLGAQMLEGWRLPQLILEAVGCHHSPEEASDEAVEIASLTEFADAIVNNVCGIGGGSSTRARDLGGTHLTRQGRGPLAEASVQQRVVRQVAATLAKKASVICQAASDQEEASEEDKEASQAGRASIPDSPTSPSLPRRSWSFWKWLTRRS